MTKKNKEEEVVFNLIIDKKDGELMDKLMKIILDTSRKLPTTFSKS